MFEFIDLGLGGVKLVKSDVYRDARGLFFEFYRESTFSSNNIKSFVQDNISISGKGVLRGLHIQKKPYSQAKLITVLKGKIFDVALDLRQNSKTFGKFVTYELSSETGYSLFIPEGFAHGFCSLEDETTILYKNNREYSPNFESGVIWNDSRVNIKWPISNPKLSDKDSKLPTLDSYISDFG